MLERHELDAFLTLAEELHFGSTAERLRVSTARISQTIARLERRVGVPLFTRTSRRVELTATGRRLAEEVGPEWARIRAAVERAIEHGRGTTGTLTVAFVGAASGQLLVGVAEVFGERLPGCRVVIREARAGEVLPWLRGGEVDLALSTLPAPDADIAAGPVLVREARMLAVPANHPYARRDSVSAADLARVPLLTEPIQEALTLVGAGQGVLPVGAHARRYHPRPDVVYVLIDDAEPVEWALLWRADGATARVRAFAEAAVDLLGQP
ncbi:LysR family transcriptional regulator [Actinokineospora fastidiosa]|nr:LysR substrate-binding domain-containing protein [Actinokineospora fastidiosa]